MSSEDRPPQLHVDVGLGAHGVTVVALEGELDIASTDRLRRILHSVLEDCVRVSVDLGELTFLDLPGVRLLVEMAAVADRRDCRFEISGATGEVARVLELTRVGSLLPIAA